MTFCQLVVLVGLFQIISPLQKTTPLRIDDIQTEEIYVRLEQGIFNILIYESHFSTDPTIVFCFRERTITSAKNNYCDLTGVQNSYKCLEIIPTHNGSTIVSVAVNVFDSDATLTSTAKTGQFPLSSSNIAIGVSQISVSISSLVSENKIYEVYAGYLIDLANDPSAKNAFFNTFRISTQISSDDLMAQRHPHCFEFYYENYINYNILFYGGVTRSGNETMFFHVLSYFAHENKSVAIGSNLNGYIGISWSKDHAQRDMAAFITANSTLFDLLSLYYNAPYLDNSVNVKGTADIVSVTDSALHTSGNASHYFYGGLARLYDTMDAFGDELIRKKMNNTYCIAVGFHNQNNTFPYSPLLTTNKHIDYGCFTSDVMLWEAVKLSSMLSLIFLALL